MANRKQELDAAVSQSRQEAAEREASQSPQAEVKPANPVAGFKLPYTKQREAEAAAPMHPRAVKGAQVRNRELQAGMAAGREQRAVVEEAGKQRVAAGEGTVGTEYKTVEGFKDTNKKVGVRQVQGYSGNKRRRKMLDSGTVVLGTDYGQTGKVRQPRAVSSAESKSKLNMLNVEAEAEKATAKYLKRPKKKSVKQKTVTKKPIKGVMGSRITPGKKGGK